MSDIDWEAVAKAQSGDTSGDKRPIKTVMESHQHFSHSADSSRRDSADKKSREEKK